MRNVRKGSGTDFDFRKLGTLPKIGYAASRRSEWKNKACPIVA